jgi:hypothetical protein
MVITPSHMKRRFWVNSKIYYAILILSAHEPQCGFLQYSWSYQILLGGLLRDRLDCCELYIDAARTIRMHKANSKSERLTGSTYK